MPCSLRPRSARFASFLVVLLLAAAPGLPGQTTALPSARLEPQRLEQYSDLAVRWMQEYLQVDTTNPPGNELRAATFLKKIFDQEGIENQVFEFAPGRADIWARVRGSGARRPLILLNHMDVVSSDPQRWRVPPFSGALVDGSLYGRGAQDMKNEALAQLLVMVMLEREHVPLDRDVIFLGTADEEVDSAGTDWMIHHQRELLGHAEYLLTEGGENLLRDDGRVAYVGIDTAEKVPFWLHLVAHGKPGHGSRPLEDSAPNRLARALGRILAHPAEMKVIPAVAQYLRDMAPYQHGPRARWFADPQAALKDPRFRAEVERDESLNYLLRNTLSLTMLGGSQQTNVIPGEAWANLDVRLLPGEDPQRFLEGIRRVVADPQVTVEPLSSTFLAANSSSTDTELFRVIRKVAASYFPGAPVTPRLTSGYDENQRYRQLGMVCYGFSPYAATSEESDTEHGDNERIRVEEVRRGYRVLYDVVVGVAGAR
ncbi:MAG TPA: M20/M25/M40 family metallo-hydrolase [Terriglobales bacterium]|nr:M20/M25/M40 family metallo-hydrolase [Terriglobales bacterium]